MRVLTLWVAVDHSDESNGCLKVAPGTHKGETRELKADPGASVLGSYTHEEAELERVVPLVLRPGDVSAHHPALVHGSDGNRSGARRCGLTLRLIPPSTRCTDPGHPVLLLRGSEEGAVNAWRQWPPLLPGRDFAGWRGADAWEARRRGGVAVRDRAQPDEEERSAVVTEVRDIVHNLGGRMADE